MSLKYQHSSKTKTEWETLNPVIVSDEIVIEKDTNLLKIGDGVKTYTQLEYVNEVEPIPGKTNYELYVENTLDSPVKSINEWLDSLKGQIGSNGAATGSSLFSIADKKMLVIGDSLSSAGSGTIDNTYVGSWCNYVKSYLSLSNQSRVIANGGCKLIDAFGCTLTLDKNSWLGANNVMSNQIYSLLNHYNTYKGTPSEFAPDIILIMMGTNNVMTVYPQNNWTSLLGDFTTAMFTTEIDPKHYVIPDMGTEQGVADYAAISTFRRTVFGAYRWAIETLLETFPNAQIYIMQPLQNSSDRGQNIFSLYDSIEKIANYFAIKLIKTAYESGLSYFTNMRTGKGWSSSWYTYDGTHPNAAGQELIGKYVATVLNSSYFNKPSPIATRTAIAVNSFTVTASISNGGDGVGGNIDLYGSNLVTSGNSFILNITPLSGFQVSEILVDGVSVSVANSYTINSVTSNHTIIVTFAALAVAVPVLSISLNASGTVSNSAATIYLNGTNTPTHYRLATSDAGLSAAAWIAYSSSIAYTLTEGVNTIFAQLKNNIGESTSANATVTYTPVVAVTPVLNSIALSASGTVSNPAITITLNATNSPTHYRLATSDAGLSAAAWIAYSSIVAYTLTEGLNNIFAQVKNDAGSSASTNATVTYTPAQAGDYIYRADLAFGQPWASNLFDAATGVYNAYAIFTVKNIYDNNNALIGTALSTNFVGYNASLAGKMTGDDSGLYKDIYLERNLFITNPAIGKIQFTLTQGTYRISLLTNIATTSAWAQYIVAESNAVVRVNGVTKNLLKLADNTDTLTVFDNVFTSNGVINVEFEATGVNKRLAISVIRIEKLALTEM